MMEDIEKCIVQAAPDMLEGFIEFVDEHSRAINEEYDKTYTIEELREYIPHYIKSL